MAKAVVASDLGGPREQIEDRVSGVLVRPDDPSALADAICALLKKLAGDTAVHFATLLDKLNNEVAGADAVVANVGSLVAFRTGSADADYLAPLFDPFAADDLRAQAAHECYWRLTVDGTPQPVVSARSLPPVARSRAGYGLDEFTAVALPGTGAGSSAGTAHGPADGSTRSAPVRRTSPRGS